jgi:hypothetical protein
VYVAGDRSGDPLLAKQVVWILDNTVICTCEPGVPRYRRRQSPKACNSVRYAGKICWTLAALEERNPDLLLMLLFLGTFDVIGETGGHC